jgi:hypothetical protein
MLMIGPHSVHKLKHRAVPFFAAFDAQPIAQKLDPLRIDGPAPRRVVGRGGGASGYIIAIAIARWPEFRWRRLMLFPSRAPPQQ